jgi:hypothetical protein
MSLQARRRRPIISNRNAPPRADVAAPRNVFAHAILATLATNPKIDLPVPMARRQKCGSAEPPHSQDSCRHFRRNDRSVWQALSGVELACEIFGCEIRLIN